MKNAKLASGLLTMVIFFSIGAGYVAGYFVYTDYKEKTAYLDSRTRFAIDKFKEMEKDLKKLYIALENTADENKIETRKVLSRLEAIKEDIGEWKSGYKTTVSQLRGDIDDLKVDKLSRMVKRLQRDINGFKMRVQDMDLKIDEARGNSPGIRKEAINIDLGKISVGKQEALKRER
ncbi:MAG: hypothetical protein P9L93_02180 [Candidatus Gorgyraea atricola]|nr:hypothetical protein [Candidatus Gorgyraea atricola]